MSIAHDVLRRRRLLDMGEARVQAVLATGPLAYWRLTEGSGTLIRDSAPGALYPGTYTGITWDGTTSPYSKPVPFYDGANDFGNVYSAALGSAFNFDEGAILLFLKVANAGVWTDGIERWCIRFKRDASNQIYIIKRTAINSMQFLRTAAGTTQANTPVGFSETTFLGLMMSWTVAGDALKAYKNGSQLGASQVGNVAASGSGLSATETTIGAANTTPLFVLNGYLAEVVVWTKPADAAMIALGVPPA